MTKKRFNEEIITEEVKEETDKEETVRGLIEDANDEILEGLEKEIAEETKNVSNCTLTIKKEYETFKINVRAKAETSAEIVTQITKDDTVRLLENDLTDEWCKVEVNELTGWAVSKYLEKSE